VLASDAIAGGYTTQVGKYTKIGNVVNVSFNVQMSSIGSFAGAVVTVTGLTIRLSDGRHRQEQHNGFRKSNIRRQDRNRRPIQGMYKYEPAPK
jgi:hypothetical protein